MTLVVSHETNSVYLHLKKEINRNGVEKNKWKLKVHGKIVKETSVPVSYICMCYMYMYWPMM